jgi:hypothetical protein
MTYTLQFFKPEEAIYQKSHKIPIQKENDFAIQELLVVGSLCH